MVKALVIAALVWPLILGAAAWQRARGAQPGFGAVVYLAASRICHQRPDRSFHTGGVQWPVCARCSGLYLAAPFGACVAAWAGRRRTRPSDRSVTWLAVAAVPTALTLALEWTGVTQPGNVLRAIAALPLGAAIAFVLVRTAAGSPQPIE